MADIDIKDICNSKFDIYIQDFQQLIGVDSMTNASQNQWTACLIYIYNHLFKDTNIFKYNPNVNNTYNIKALDKVLDVYIYYSSMYSKEINIHGFLHLAGIDFGTFDNWRAEPSCEGFHLAKKLTAAREASNSDLLGSGKNPVGIIARLNHHDGWNMPGVRTDSQKITLSVDKLPQLQQSASVPALPDSSEV